VSSRLMSVLQTAAFPFRHCIAPPDGIEPPSAGLEPAVLPLNERGVLVRVRGSAPRPPRSKRGTLLHELHPGMCLEKLARHGR
jgi:hypothetical protein